MIKSIFKKCNFLIIIFFSQIAQATTLEKFNVTCFPHGWHNKNISFCSIFSNHNVWNEMLLVFRVLFPRIFFQTAPFEILHCFFSVYHFPVLFKSQRLKYFVTCVMLSNIFPYFFKNKFIFVAESIFYKFYILSISTTKCTNTTACYIF